MIISHRLNLIFSTYSFVWISIGTAALYWVLESCIHVLFFGGGGFAEELITPDVHEIWKRLLVISLLIMFGIFAEQYFSMRRRAESALKESEKKYRTIFEQALNPIFLFDDKGRFVDNNEAALHFLECTREELTAKEFKDIAAGKSPQDYSENSSFSDESRMLEVDHPLKTHSKTMLLNIVPLSIAEKNLLYGIGQDITQRKQMERTLKQAYAELNQIFQTASVGMRLVDRDCNVLKINKTFADMAHVSEAAAVDKKCYEIFSGPMCQTTDCPITKVVQGEYDFETYVDKKRPDGRIIPCILTATPFTGSDGEIIGIVESFRDITQLRKAHEIIYSERDKLHCILSHLLEGVSIIGSDFTIEYQNDILKKELGDCKGKTCYTVFRGLEEPCSPCLMRQVLTSGSSQHIEYETPGGRSFEQAYTGITDIDGKDKVVTLLRDITEKKNSLAAAMHADRLAAVGELAAGVAHEINNPINGIINYAQIISNKSSDNDATKDIAERVIKEGNRIARIVESLLIFSRRQHEGKMLASVAEILSDTLTLTSAQIRRDNIVLQADLADNLPGIMVHTHEIEQVFINIINNSRYALKQKYKTQHHGKLLQIRTRLIKKERSAYVRISFIDHGTGIPATIIDKVKNPFFTTKTDEKRTGLGLSISHGIIDNHGGELTIESEEGESTTIHIDLPAWQALEQSGLAQ